MKDNINKHKIAVEITPRKIIVARGRRKEGNFLKINGFVLEELRTIDISTVISPTSIASKVKEIIQGFEKRIEKKITEIHIGTTEQYSRSYNQKRAAELSGKKLTQAQLDEFLKESFHINVKTGEELISLLPQYYVINHKEKSLNPLNKKRVKHLQLQSYVIIGRKSFTQQLILAFEEQGFSTTNSLFNPIATAQAVLEPIEMKIGVALICMTSTSTNVIVYKNNTVYYIEVFSFGGDTITAAIKEEFGINYQEAEQLKQEYGVALKELANEDIVRIKNKKVPIKKLAAIIQKTTERIIKQIAIKLEDEGLLDTLGAGIVLTGGGAMLNNILDLFFNTFNKKIRIGTPIKKLGKNISEQGKRFDNPRFSTIVGLLLQASQQQQDNVATPVEEEKELAVANREKNSSNAFTGIYKSVKTSINKAAKYIDEGFFGVEDEKM